MYVYIQGFSHWGMGGESPPHQPKIFSYTHPRKIPPSRLPPLSPIFYPTLPPLPRTTK